MSLKDLTDKMQKLIDVKGWGNPESSRPQTPKNIAISLMLEAAELLEHFQWTETPESKQELAHELADVQLYLLQLAALCDIDIGKACEEKLAINYRREWRP